MSAMVPFSGGSLPAYIKNKSFRTDVNKDVAHAAQFATLSIKGKVFTISKDNERKMITRVVDGEAEPAPRVNLAVIRANTKARVFYAKAYVEGDDQGTRPTCASSDGVAPLADVVQPQSAKCAICPHAVWGTGNDGNGTACSVNTRLAVADPDKIDFPMLLRVPAGSRKNFNDAVKAAETRGIPYNALVYQVGFDPEAPSPKLTFKPVGFLDDATFAKAEEAYESDLLKEMMGINKPTIAERAALPAPERTVAADELDAVIAGRAASLEDDVEAAITPQVKAEAAKAVAKAKPKAKPVEEAPPAPPAKATVEASADTGMDDLMGELDNLLSVSDD